MAKVVAIVSGGMDSVTMAYKLKSEGHELCLLAIDYGQRHRKEHEFAQAAAERLQAEYEEADLRALGRIMRGSSITDLCVDVPDKTNATVAYPNGNPNVVPNRNAVLLSVAFAKAVAEKAEAVAIGILRSDSASSPDCSPGFLRAFNDMERIATSGYAHEDLILMAPLSDVDKSGVVALGESLGVPWTHTWTCLRGDDMHCGRCAPCVERRDAFAQADVPDPTKYQEVTR